MSEQPQSWKAAPWKVALNALVRAAVLSGQARVGENPEAIEQALEPLIEAVVVLREDRLQITTIGENGLEAVLPLTTGESEVVVHTPIGGGKPRYLKGSTPKTPSAPQGRA